MVIRIATFDTKPELAVDEERLEEFRNWMKEQPGFRSAWHASDSKTGKSVSISVWQDMPSLLAMKDRKFPGPPIERKPDKVELFDDVAEF
jgi:hypothetical protein